MPKIDFSSTGLPKIDGPGSWETRGPAAPAWHPFDGHGAGGFGTDPLVYEQIANAGQTPFPKFYSFRACELSSGCEYGEFCNGADATFGRWCANGMAPQLPRQYPDIKGRYSARTLTFMTCDAELGFQPGLDFEVDGGLKGDGRRVAICVNGKWEYANTALVYAKAGLEARL